jgi:hypothetical protein
MAHPSLGVIDAGEFPVVHIHGPRLVPGDGPRIIEDLETLIRHDQAFVLVIVNGDDSPQRQHDEDKARMLWLKENKARLATVCKGIVSVMPDRQRLPLVEKQAAGLQAALGIPFLVAANLIDANAQGRSLLDVAAPSSID